jgi:hypothetical protein
MMNEINPMPHVKAGKLATHPVADIARNADVIRAADIRLE